jgi:dTDP-4-amino-4,6-dideoxygalactose transaminase
MIPLVDLARRQRSLAGEIEQASARVLASGRYLLGPELEAFEAELAAWSGYRYAVGVAPAQAARGGRKS